MKIEADECRAALTLIRRTIEEHWPPGVVPSEEAVNGLYGPEPMGRGAGGCHSGYGRQIAIASAPEATRAKHQSMNGGIHAESVSI